MIEYRGKKRCAVCAPFQLSAMTSGLLLYLLQTMLAMRRWLPAINFKLSGPVRVLVILLSLCFMTFQVSADEPLPDEKKSESPLSGEKKIDSLLKVLADNAQAGGDSLQNRLVYSKLAELFFQSRNYTLALDYYFRILRLVDREKSDSTHNCLIYSDLYSQIGLCYFSIANTNKALTYFTKSLERIDACKGKIENDLFNKRRTTLVINIGSVHLDRKDFEKARHYYENALSDEYTFDNKVWRAALYNNLGIIAKEQKKYDKAFDYYHMALDIRTSLKDTAGMAQVLNNLGQCYFWVNDFTNAEQKLKRSLDLTTGSGNIRSEMFAYQFLSSTYELSGRYRDALEMHKLYKDRYDSLINSESVANSTRLEMRYEYEKQLRDHQVKQQLLVNQKERKATIFLAAAGVMLLLFIIAILWIRNQRIKISQVELSRKGLELERKNLALEKDNLALLNEKLGIELEYRKKELATQVMYLLQKNELIAKTIKEIQQIKQDGAGDQALHSILRALKSNLDTGAWEEFEVRFQQVHRDFYDKLQSLYPDLSPNEIKLSAFLRLNMTTKDISAITFHTPKSIQVARTRLRKKLNIEREENLVTYLQQL